jgi:nucleoid DNA-binding protein
MENYILQILESNSRVIVPEFGAFIIKQRNPFTIVFNEFLQYNDGMLVDAIAKSESISREAAKQKIDDYIREINGTLEKGNVYPLGKLGVITKGSSGKISLEKADERAWSGKKFAEKKVEADKPKTKTTARKKTETIEKPVAEPPAKEVPVNQVSEQVVKKEIEPEKSEKVPGKTEVVEKKEVKIPVAKAEIPETKAEIPKAETSDIIHEQKISPPVQPSKTLVTEEPVRPVEFTVNNSSPRYKRRNIIIWGIVIILINALLVGYFIYSNELKGLFVSKTQDTLSLEPIIEEPVTGNDSMEKPVVNQETSQDIQDNITTTSSENRNETAIEGTRYYIVAGVFRDETNATNLVTELRKKRFNAQKFGKIGDLHAVSYEVFKTKNEADEYLIKIHKETDPEAWIRTVK